MQILKNVFFLIMFLHGLIHILGFVKAFDLTQVSTLTANISKTAGSLWLLTASLFVVSSIFWVLKKDWADIALVGVVLSQILIFMAWSDAKYGTIANVIIFAVSIIALFGSRFEKSFVRDATASLLRSEQSMHVMLKTRDILHLPLPVQKYLHFADVIGKPKVRNMKVVMSGQMRYKEKDWFDFTSIQYNTFDKYDRLFFMKAKVNNLPTAGYHYFKDKEARMDIKLLSTFPVVSESSEWLRKAETVTIFNDMCIMAPASLISPDIKWEEVSENEVIAHFTNEDITISATLFFDNDGALINFYSEDRIDINDKENYGFSTPISGFKEYHGNLNPTYGEAIWHHPEGEFTYGKFNIKAITYNVKKVQI